MPLNRPFLDASGKRGKPKLTSKTVSNSKLGKQVRFRNATATHITLELPENKVIHVTKNDGRRLAYWLLDVCSTDSE